jgi:multidrug efflux pump subunit AcrA (membrane-fusion protein)
VDVANPGRVLLPGLYAEATLTLEKKDNAVAVPLQAVDQEDNRATVYIIDAANKIEVRPIGLGIQTPTDAEVVSGLQEGELVVVSDRSGLKAGQSAQAKITDLMQYRSTEEQH